MAEWRVLRGWSSEALRARIDALAAAGPPFDAVESAEMTGEQGWHHYHSEAVIAREHIGGGCFDRARVALSHYQFSDPAIVVAHFDPASSLLGRRLLLEIKVLGLHYLCPVRVDRVRDERGVFGFRYGTLPGHIERGVEWFLLTQDDRGEIRFRIEAFWRPGDFPNWWSRLGFALMAGYFQRRWHRHAHRRMARLARDGQATPPGQDASGLAHQGVDVTFTYHTKKRWLG